MPRKLLALLFILAPLLWGAESRAQNAEAKLAALERLAPPERQQRLYDLASVASQIICSKVADYLTGQRGIEPAPPSRVLTAFEMRVFHARNTPVYRLIQTSVNSY